MAKASTKDLDNLPGFLVTGSAGDIIFKEGDEAADVFILEDGRVELVRESRPGSPPLAVLGRGDVFGEGALVDGQPREVSARALSDFQAVRLDRATFEHLAGEDPGIGMSLVRRLAGYLREERAARVTGTSARRARATSRRPPAEPPMPSKRPSQPTLIAPAAKLEFALTGTELTVGRLDRATGLSPDIDLTAADTERSLSRKHARIVSRDGRIFVRAEAGARNGTFVNGQRIADGLDVELVDGARVRFGLVETIFLTPG
jgi:hypothetical protein